MAWLNFVVFFLLLSGADAESPGCIPSFGCDECLDVVGCAWNIAPNYTICYPQDDPPHGRFVWVYTRGMICPEPPPTTTQVPKAGMSAVGIVFSTLGAVTGLFLLIIIAILWSCRDRIRESVESRIPWLRLRSTGFLDDTVVDGDDDADVSFVVSDPASPSPPPVIPNISERGRGQRSPNGTYTSGSGRPSIQPNRYV